MPAIFRSGFGFGSAIRQGRSCGVTVCAFPVFAFLIGEEHRFSHGAVGAQLSGGVFRVRRVHGLESTGSPSLALLRRGRGVFRAHLLALYLVHINVLIFVFLVFRVDRTIDDIAGGCFDGIGAGDIGLDLLCKLSMSLKAADQDGPSKSTGSRAIGKAAAKSSAAAAL